MPGVGAVGGVAGQGAEKGRGKRAEIAARLADDVPGHELGRVLEHVNKAVQLLQHVVGQVPAGARLAVEEDGNVGVAKSDFLDEVAQLDDDLERLVDRIIAAVEFLVVDRDHERRHAGLLLGKGGEVDVAGNPEHLFAFGTDRFGQRANAQARYVLGAKILVDNDDGEAEDHGWSTSGSAGGCLGETKARSSGRRECRANGKTRGRAPGEIVGQVYNKCPPAPRRSSAQGGARYA